MSDLDRLRELGKELPHDRPDGERREAMRARLVAEADATAGARGGKARWLLVGGGFVGGIAVAAAIALVIFHRAPAVEVATTAVAPVSAAVVIESSTAAELEHVTTASGEVVRVHAGTVRLAVDGAAAARPVVVKTADAEIDATTKTTYELAVDHDKLVRLAVTEGRATLAIAGQHTVILAAGETWTAPVITAELTPAAIVLAPVRSDARVATTPPDPQQPSTRTSPSPSPSPSPNTTSPSTSPDAGSDSQAESGSGGASSEVGSPPSSGTTPTEQHFAAGWTALRANDYARAATELGLAADGDGPIAADARYFQAIAFTKAGRKTQAERAYVQFLDRAPKSLRRGRAAVSLARLIAERGDRAAARAWFASAAADPDPAVAAAAKAGLAAPQ